MGGTLQNCASQDPFEERGQIPDDRIEYPNLSGIVPRFDRPSPEQRTVTVITVAIPASAVDKEWLGRCGGRARCLVCGSSGWLLPDALIAHGHLNRQGFTP